MEIGIDSAASWWFALALPVIVAFYLLKKTYSDKRVPSTMLWERALKESEANRPWQRLRSRLLLILQLLAAALLVLTLVKPYLWIEKHAGESVVYVIDNSASMAAATPNGSTRLEVAKSDLLGWASKEAKSSRHTVIVFGDGPQVVVSGARSLDDLKRAVQPIQPYYGQADYEEAVSLAAAIARDEGESEIRLYTDGHWPETIDALGLNVPLSVQRVGGEEADNVSVVQFGVRSGTVGGAVSATASVKNWSGRDREIGITVYAGEQIAEQRKENWKAGEQKALSFSGLPVSEVYRLEVSAGDALKEDNTAYAFPSGRLVGRAVLAGEGNLFLEKALALAGVEVVKATMGQNGYVLPDSSFDWAVIDSVNEHDIRSSEWSKTLADKPVWYIHAGIEGTDSGVPAALYTVTDHPVTRYIRLQDSHVAASLQGTVPVWAKPIVSAERVPLVLAGEENGQPRLLFTFDLHQSDLPLRPEFPVLVQNAAEWLGASSPTQLGSAVASMLKDIPVSAKTAEASWIRIDTGEERQAEKKDGVVNVTQPVPNVPGLYRFVEKDSAGQEVRTRMLAVVMDARESDPAQRTEIAPITKEQPNGPNSPAAEEGKRSKPNLAKEDKTAYPLTLWLAALVLLLVVAEWGVYRRGHSL